MGQAQAGISTLKAVTMVSNARARWWGVALLPWAAALATGLAQAGTMSYAGQFNVDNDKWVLPFTLSVSGTVSWQTFSYSGGVNAAGDLIGAGGFAPVVSLFDANGGFVLDDRGATDGCSTSGASDCWDAALTLAGMAAGPYTLVLTQDNNVFIGGTWGSLSDPAAFVYDGTGNEHYTASICNADPSATFVPYTDCTQTRSNAWALDLSTPDATAGNPIPEPASMGLVLAALGLAGAASRRR
jgi:MYXO-CTERM domain-containing protein